ncbi:unnamed protein product [Prorocentrum cordatum]|uniref:Uncharacterized protein n=1 Tax=Prorocentrum cordatum TaxID=2364126 RepID=A0ABN9UFE9_9DINO|nr:unnamed protein product [Polarella glacialis]
MAPKKKPRTASGPASTLHCDFCQEICASNLANWPHEIDDDTGRPVAKGTCCQTRCDFADASGKDIGKLLSEKGGAKKRATELTEQRAEYAKSLDNPDGRDFPLEEVYLETISDATVKEQHTIVSKYDFESTHGVTVEEAKLRTFKGTNGSGQEISGIVQRGTGGDVLELSHTHRVVRRTPVMSGDDHMFKQQAELIFREQAKKNQDLLGFEVGDRYKGKKAAIHIYDFDELVRLSGKASQAKAAQAKGPPPGTQQLLLRSSGAAGCGASPRGSGSGGGDASGEQLALCDVSSAGGGDPLPSEGAPLSSDAGGVTGVMHEADDDEDGAVGASPSGKVRVQPPSYWLAVCSYEVVLQGKDGGHFQKRMNCARACVTRPGTSTIDAGRLEIALEKTQACLDLRDILAKCEGDATDWDGVRPAVAKCVSLNCTFGYLETNKNLLGVKLLGAAMDLAQKANDSNFENYVSDFVSILSPFSRDMFVELGGVVDEDEDELATLFPMQKSFDPLRPTFSALQMPSEEKLALIRDILVNDVWAKLLGRGQDATCVIMLLSHRIGLLFENAMVHLENVPEPFKDIVKVARVLHALADTGNDRPELHYVSQVESAFESGEHTVLADLRVIIKRSDYWVTAYDDILKNEERHKHNYPRYEKAVRSLKRLDSAGGDVPTEITRIIDEERPDYVSGVRSTRKLDVVGQQKADSYLRNMLRDIADKNNTVDSCRLDALLTFATTVSACWPDNSDIVASRQKLQVLQRELKSSTMKASMVSAAELCEASPGDTDNYEEMHRLVCDAAGAQLAPEEAAGIVGSMAACLRYLCSDNSGQDISADDRRIHIVSEVASFLGPAGETVVEQVGALRLFVGMKAALTKYLGLGDHAEARAAADGRSEQLLGLMSERDAYEAKVSDFISPDPPSWI